MSRRMVAAGIAAGAGMAAVLTAGYAAAGPSGLVDAASVAAVGVLIAARVRLAGQEPPPVRPGYPRPSPKRRPAVSEADFPAYRKILSQVSWARMPGPHHEQALRSMLARLAAALDRPQAVAADLEGPSGAAGGPGVDLATLERIVTGLEER